MTNTALEDTYSSSDKNDGPKDITSRKSRIEWIVAEVALPCVPENDLSDTQDVTQAITEFDIPKLFW